MGAAAVDWLALGDSLRTAPAAQLAADLGVPPSAVRDARLRLGIIAVRRAPTGRVCVEWDAQPLGSMTDRAMAELLGVSASAVRHQRIARGIPAHAPTTRGIDWSAVRGLGVLPDVIVARLQGVAVPVARQARLRRGLTAPTMRELRAMASGR
jgi:hypothetical protein